ncbi:MAG: aminotransferase class IV [Phycisphaeraceae bacterium]|nr:MAG: aminotransferase class IV [Phycisphaeraceae bacterium]
MQTVFLNGAFVERDDAAVSAFDAGLQHGVGLFETMLGVRRGGDCEVVGLGAHVERLSESARMLRLSEDLHAEGLGSAIVQTFERSGMDRARLRLTVTGGDLNLLEAAGRSNFRPTVLVVAQPVTDYPEAMFEHGVLATIADARANPFAPTAGHKTLDYWWRLRELQQAAAKGAGESIVLQVSNHVAGGCVSNLLAVHGEALLTPIARGEEQAGAMPSPVLPGVTRGMVVGWAEEMGLDVRRQMMTVDDLLDADELMLTNSSWGVLPVTRVEGATIGGGEPGPVTRRLVERWGALVAGDSA